MHGGVRSVKVFFRGVFKRNVTRGGNIYVVRGARKTRNFGMLMVRFWMDMLDVGHRPRLLIGWTRRSA